MVVNTAVRREVFLCVALCLLFYIASVPIARADDICAHVFKGPGWHESQNTVLLQAIEDIQTKSKTHLKIFPCEGNDVRLNGALSNKPLAELDVIMVAVSTRLLTEYPESIEALLAHELAHFTTPAGYACTLLARHNLIAEYTACESSVDIAAAQWVGAEAMIHALRALTAYYAKYAIIPPTADTFSTIEYRIEALARMQ